MKCDWLLNHSQTNESNHKNQFFRVDSFHWFIYWYGKFLAGCLNNWYINTYGNCQFWRLCTPCSWGVQVWMNKIVELVLPMIGQVYVPWIIHGNTSRLTCLLNNIPFSFSLLAAHIIHCMHLPFLPSERRPVNESIGLKSRPCYILLPELLVDLQGRKVRRRRVRPPLTRTRTPI